LENEVYQQHNEELMVKVQMLEAEVERKEAALAKMATEKQQGLKRQGSMGTIGTAPISDSDLGVGGSSHDCSFADSSGSDEEDHENDHGSTVNGAKLQGELLRLRSSLDRMESANQEQAKEISSLREQLEQSQEAQRLSQVEATLEDYRNENKQLKQKLAEVEAARQAELLEVEKLKQSNTEKTQALKQAEGEKTEALSQLETSKVSTKKMKKITMPRESTINKVLDIGAPAQYGTTGSPTETADTIIEESEDNEESDESDPDPEQVVPPNPEQVVLENKNWFGFGGGDRVSDITEEEGNGWFGFGFGQTENIEEAQVGGEMELDSLLDF